MKSSLNFFATLLLLFACTPQENKTDHQDGEADKTVHVTGITLDPSTMTIKEGESFLIVATITPENADNKDITWSSSSDAVAIVDNDGRVTGVQAGNATVTAKTKEGNITASCAITVVNNLAPSVTMYANHISAISAEVAGKANLESSIGSNIKMGIIWSKNSEVLPSNSTKTEATNMDGDFNYSVGLTGLEPETIYYYRSYVTQNGQDSYGETKSFITKELSSLLKTLDATEMGSSSAKLNAFLDLTDISYDTMEYGFFLGSSENTQSTKFPGKGIIENEYTYFIQGLLQQTQYWYKAYVKLDNQSFSGEVKTFTTDIAHVTSVFLNKKEYTIRTIGNSITLFATVYPENAKDKSVSWSSDNTDVATVDSSGKVTAVNNGKATITVTTNDQNKTATCTIVVSQYVTGIELDKTSLALIIGESGTLSVKRVTPSNAYDKTYTWTSSDESIATIKDGVVRAISKGKATISVEAQDGSGTIATCDVIVSNPCPEGAVDMGVLSRDGYRLYWAKSNLSTSGLCAKPEEYGDYYAWGETEVKSDYSWSTYKFYTGSLEAFSDYNGTNSTLKTGPNGDDVASKILGGNWRIPRESEWHALQNQCKLVWTNNYINYFETGVAGEVVIGSNGNNIFLPAAGRRESTEEPSFLGTIGFYWSSDRDYSSQNWAEEFYFKEEKYRVQQEKRSSGLSVRPVTE